MTNVIKLGPERARRIVSAEQVNAVSIQGHINARIELAAWVETHSALGTPFLLAALRNAIGAIEAFEDLIRE